VIHLQTLGGLDLRGSGGESLAAVTSRPREMGLLIYLAFAGPGAFRRRDTILALFWPESPEDRARHTLNQMLYRLRRALGDEALISRGQDDIGTSADHLRCDAADFRQALEEARWEDALTLYRGPFLPGFFVSGAPDLERWIDEERQAHRRGARDAAAALSEQLEREGDLRGAADWARRAWEIEPASDSLLRRPLALLHRLGERSEALVLFETFRRRMADEYGLEPSVETMERVARIRGEGVVGSEGGGQWTAVPDATAGEAGPGPGSLFPVSFPQGGRGLGGTLAGAGAALVGAAAVAWVLLSSGSVTPQPAVSEGTVPVVVVLPVAVSGSVSPDYGDLARALTTELTNRLGEVPGLLVVPQKTVEPHLGEALDPLELGRRLRGDAVVESRLEWEPAGVVTRARVMEVGSGETLWDASHSYPHNEILNAQLDLTVGLASALNVRMATLPLRDLTFSSGAELQAWALVSRAKDTIERGTFDSVREAAARTLVQRALDLVPDFAPAYAAQASLYTRIWLARREDSQWVDSMVAAAERAVALDPDHFASQLSLAQAMRTAVLSYPVRYPPGLLRRAAEAALRAVQLNPGSPEASLAMRPFWREGAGGIGREFLWTERATYLEMDWGGVLGRRSYFFWLLGDYEAAIETRRISDELNLDPQDPSPVAFRVPEWNLSRGRLREARRQIEAVRARDPDNVMTVPIVVYLDLMEERFASAEELIEELLSRDPPVEEILSSNFFSRTALGYVYLKTGRVREGRRLLEMVRDVALDRIERGPGYALVYDLTRVYAMLEDPDRAIYWLQVAIDRGWPFYYTEMGPTDPMLENLLENPKFQRIMADLKAELDAEREWAMEMLALPEPERFHAMLMDAEERLEVLWEAQGAG
jgi:DNA-binding SARP family transcriptional activator/tetratricopeptide (TPR) repeat protein